MVISPVYAYTFARQCKVENILKVSLDLTPSPTPSVKIQIMGRKVCLRCKGKTLLGDQQTYCYQKFVENAQ